MKKTKLLAAILLMFIILAFNNAYSQNDSLINKDSLKKSATEGTIDVYNVEDSTYFYTISRQINYGIRSKKTSIPMHKQLEDISPIIFKQNDSLSLLNTSGESVSVDLKQVDELKIKTGTHLWTGVMIGAPSGALIGLIIGAIVDNNNKPNFPSNTIFAGFNNLHFDFGKVIGAVAGTLSGAILGGIIGSQIYK